MNVLYRIATILFLFSFSLSLPLTAYAHKLRIFAWPEGDMIYGETAFSGNRKPKNAEITVLEAGNREILLTTRTDDQGKFRFTVPEKAVSDHLDLLLVVNAGEGHRGEWPLPAAEYLSSALPPKEAAAVKESPSTPEIQPVPARVGSANTLSIDEQLLRRIVDEELEKKLSPLKYMLAQSSDTGPKLQDILGGIGYILGLAGIFALMQARKQKNKEEPR